MIAPVAPSMPLGMSTATTGMASPSTAAKTSAASSRSGPDPGDTDHAVDDEIGCRGDAVDDPAAGLAEGGQTLLMGAIRFEQYASAATPRRREKDAAQSASPPLSPEPTTAHTRRPATPPVRAINSPMIAVANP